MSRLYFSIVSLSFALILPMAAQAEELVPKQLAGPPEEFTQMQSPDPAQSATLSKSALLPVQLTAQAGGARWEGALPAENGHLRFMVFSGDADWQVAATAPGKLLQANAAMLKGQATTLGASVAGAKGVFYAVDKAADGAWTLQLRSNLSKPQQGYLMVEGDERTELASYLRNRHQLVGQPLTLNTVLGGSDARGRALLGAQVGRVKRAELRIIAPDGEERTVAMTDDGMHGDGEAGDGIYGSSFVPDRSGTWIAQVVVHGRDRDGRQFVRTTEHVLPVIDTVTRVRGDVQVSEGYAGRLMLNVPIFAQGADTPTHYRVFGEVWGTSAAGKPVPVAWVGGMSFPHDGHLPLGLDMRWIARAGALAPFTLHNLRVEDPDNFVPLAQVKSLPMVMPAKILAGLSPVADSSIVIDDVMRMGHKPQTPPSPRNAHLLLVHGYCSGPTWPEAQFSNAATFLDPNQSRSNDQFARLLGKFGSRWQSFGTLAHSQGGIAALHLYAYYFSGLDYARGERLLQSVGTPYQGTALAGILAAIGKVVGVGCGTNTDLTYDGAQAWLAGIPSWARAKVNYYTTSSAERPVSWLPFSGVCNLGASLFLHHPNDGTTEQVNGQLPGGINRGHTFGECHVDGMNYPAQYHDTERNAVMDTDAAR
ncbi:choice-of-anchor X domain-containing protein [Xanthomonas theicola]|uniref:Conditioned medium factor n=1 Tax=Xanthomonas theicola TaxID=56464 RepID=A0A2S6ZB58_9XANT|nr:choice-of-anchor X domain-containing protein [Xanthomonas theicola]PPT82300.1 conditioned medium factor [Xanthomonas theicola]QNH26584.1 conditioned medium factor [Xanthomonas theicola]